MLNGNWNAVPLEGAQNAARGLPDAVDPGANKALSPAAHVIRRLWNNRAEPGVVQRGADSGTRNVHAGHQYARGAFDEICYKAEDHCSGCSMMKEPNARLALYSLPCGNEMKHNATGMHSVPVMAAQVNPK